MERLRYVDSEGFSLIELLVVVLILGILSSIALPIFLGQQDGARDAAAVTELEQTKKALVAWSVNHNGAYTTSLPALVDSGYASTSIVSGTAITIALSGPRFCVQATSSTGTTFKVTDSTGPAIGVC